MKEKINFLQVIEQNDEEKIKMYMKSKKIDLVKMLIESTKLTGLLIESIKRNKMNSRITK